MSLITDGGFRALIVDDDVLSRDIAASILRRLGAREIVEADSGAAAIAWADADQSKLDLVLCDLRMPQIDGLETLEELAKRTYPRLFVLVSGADRRTIRAAAGAAARVGADSLRVVSKPVTLEKMQAIVTAMSEAAVLPEQNWNLLQTSPPECSSDIVRGLASGEFVPFFVPQVQSVTCRADSVEAVMRWRHSRFGVLSEKSFMTVAQSVGVLDQLFFSIFEQSIVQCVAWREKGIAIGMSINVPPSVLTARDLPQRLESAARLHGLAPHQITLEVAETEWLQDRANAQAVLTRLRLRGFGLAIDDFGAGFSSIQQLLAAPFNEMKLDASFMARTLVDRESAVALSSYLAVARELDMTVVAQGVETQLHQEHAARLGCDQIQGSLIGQPMNAEACEEWLSSRDLTTPGAIRSQSAANTTSR